MKPPSGVIGEEGVEIERVAMVRVDAAKPETTEWVTPANLHVYEFDWRPDGQGLAYVAADPPGENNWWVAKLYTQTLNEAPKAILAPAEIPGPLHGLQIAVPRWSPDGKPDRFHRRIDERPGSDGRGCVDCFRLWRPTRQSDAATANLTGVDRVGRQPKPLCQRAGWLIQQSHPSPPAKRSSRIESHREFP